MANATIALPAANSPQFNDRVKQLLETREGLRGNELDRFIKFGDLVDQEFINSLAAKYPTPITKTDKNGYIGDIYLHPPINLSIVAGAFSNVLTWAVSASQRVYYYEIRVAEVVADSPAPAVTDFTRKIIVTHPGFSCTDAGLDPANTDYYYWIRAVDFSGEHFSAWVEGNILVDVVMRNTIEHVLDVLRGGYPDNYAAGTRYYLDDQVYYVTNGRAYICINDNSGAGILGVVPTDTTKWRRSGILFVGDVDGVPMVGIDGGMVVDGTVYARHLAASIITALHVGTNEIIANTANIKNGIITNAKINDLSADKINAGTLNAAVVSVTNLNATNITGGTLNVDRINTGSLNYTKLQANAATNHVSSSHAGPSSQSATISAIAGSVLLIFFEITGYNYGATPLSIDIHLRLGHSSGTLLLTKTIIIAPYTQGLTQGTYVHTGHPTGNITFYCAGTVGSLVKFEVVELRR